MFVDKNLLAESFAFFWPWSLSRVPSVRCDPSVGQIQAPADDLESWRRLGTSETRK